MLLAVTEVCTQDFQFEGRSRYSQHRPAAKIMNWIGGVLLRFQQPAEHRPQQGFGGGHWMGATGSRKFENRQEAGSVNCLSPAGHPEHPGPPRWYTSESSYPHTSSSRVSLGLGIR